MPTMLVITTLLPLLGALVLFALPGMDRKSARWLALITVLVTMALSVILVANFRVGIAGPQFAFIEGGSRPSYGLEWLSIPHSSGIRFALGLDGISLWLYVLTSVLVITSIFSSWEPIDDRAAMHYGLMLALHTGLLGLFASLDILLFYVFFEFTLIPLFFLIGIYGGPERRRASIVFFLYTLAGSLLTLLGVIGLILIHRAHSPGHLLTFSIPELTSGLAALPWDQWQREATISLASPQVLIFLLLFAGFAIKVPLFPFHTWLPLAHVEAPTAGSILLAGVLLKVGGYGLLRFNLAMTPHGASYLMPALAVIAIIGIIYGALTALAQSDVKRLVAYSSVSHMGFVALGMFSLTATGTDGAVLQMINHGLTTGALFACVGVLYERYHTREMSEVGGLWERLPLLAFYFILTGLAASAVPGLNGFAGEFPILLGMFTRNRLWGILGATGMVLGAYYIMVMLQRVVFGPLVEPGGHSGGTHAPAPSQAHSQGEAARTPHPVRRVGWHEIAGLTPLMVLIVAIGVYPKPFYDRISPSIRPITARFPAVEPEARPVGAIVTKQARPEPETGVAPGPLAANPAPVQDRAR